MLVLRGVVPSRYGFLHGACVTLVRVNFRALMPQAAIVSALLDQGRQSGIHGRVWIEDSTQPAVAERDFTRTWG